MLKAKIITIGDELLIGQVADTNSSFIARSLDFLGIDVAGFMTVHDTPEATCTAVSSALCDADIVITTGGLGPTKDDLTKAAIGQLFGSTEYKTSEQQLQVIQEILGRRGIEMTPENRSQADVPDVADVIVNKIGTAPIMAFTGVAALGAGAVGHRLYCMPGVPFETRAALPDVLDDIAKTFAVERNILHRSVMTYGIAESTLSRLIEPWETALPEDMHLAYLPDPLLGVRLRLTHFGADGYDVLENEVEKLCALIPDNVYARVDTTLQKVIVELLKQRGQKLAVAESLTGGNISHLLTLVSGCSAVYNGSVTSYTNEVKMNVLGVPAEVIQEHTEVSSECAEQMALGVKRLLGSDYALATTGFAEGDDPHAWVGVALPDGSVRTTLLRCNSTRAVNIDRFSASALFFLYKAISQ